MSKKTLVVISVLLVSTILICIAAVNSRYRLDADPISYISIAEHYAKGDIKTAINGYWSPMVSLLMVPLLWLNVDGRFAFAIINALVAVLILMLGSKLVLSRTRGSILGAVVYIAGATIFLVAVINSFHPDLLLSAWILAFITVLIYADKKYKAHTRKFDIICGVLIGVVGAIGYLIKLYALPFFVVTFLIWAFVKFGLRLKTLKYLSSWHEWVKRGRMIAIAFITFILLITPWVVAISKKYNYITIGSSATINTNSKFVTASTNKKSTKSEISANKNLQTKILVPPYSTAITTSEDLTPINKPKKSTLSDLTLSEAFKNYVTGRAQGIPLYLNNLQLMWPALMVLTVGITIGTVLIRNRYINSSIIIMLLSFWVYFIGYAMLAGSRGGNIRYYWPLLILGLVIACSVIGVLSRSSKRLYKYFAIILSVIVIASLVATYAQTSIGQLAKNAQPGRLEQVADMFARKYKPSAYDDYLSNNGRQNKNFAFFVNGQAYGSPDAGHEFAKIRHEDLTIRGIDYFLHFTSSNKLEFDPTVYGGKLLDSYKLGSDFLCEDQRLSQPSACTLYIIKVLP